MPTSADERTQQNHPPAAEFARRRLQQRVVPTAFITRYHVIKTKKETRPFPKIESQNAEFQGKKNEVDPGSEPDWDGPCRGSQLH